MRHLWLASAIVFSSVSGGAFGQPDTPAPRPDRGLLERLLLNGIHVGPDDEDLKGYRATTIVVDAKTVKAMDLLAQIKDLSAIFVSLEDPKYTQDMLKSIEALTQVKKLTVSAGMLTIDDLKAIGRMRQLEFLSLRCKELSNAHLKALESIKSLKSLNLDCDAFSESQLRVLGKMQALKELELKCPELSDAETKELHALARLKRLELVCGEVSPKSLDDLKRALRQAKIEFRDTLFPVKVLDTDSALTKLQKEKFNVALARIPFLTEIPKTSAGGPIDRSAFTARFLEGSRQLVDAALDLNDPKLALRTIDAHVRLMENAFKLAEERYKTGAMPPDDYLAIRYHYLDAQILQLRHKKKLQAK
jgi:hypothetical protein